MNFGTPVPLLLGIFLVLTAVALFFLDKLKPGYERDVDKVFAVLFLLSGIFLLANLQMELLASFQQMIMVGMLLTLLIQNIQSRNPKSGRFDQSPGYEGGPGRDNYRPSRPSRPSYRPDPITNVRAELDMGGMPPDPRSSRSRPMLGSRDDRLPPRSPYPQESYPDSFSDGPSERSNIPPNGSDYAGPASADDYYGGGSSSRSDGRNDERVRRRRPSRSRSDLNDRYRLQGNPTRPDYPPERDY